MSESLCVLVNNFGKIPKTTLVQVFTDFFTDDEISDAKKVLMEQSDLLLTPKPDDLKRIKARVGEGKRRRDMDDMIVIYSILDNRKVQLPRVLCADSNRIPSFRDVDISKMLVCIGELTSKVSELSSTVEKLSDKCETVSNAQVALGVAYTQTNHVVAMTSQSTQMVPTTSQCIQTEDCLEFDANSSASGTVVGGDLGNDARSENPWLTVRSNVRSSGPVLTRGVRNGTSAPSVIQPIMERRKITGTGTSASKLSASSPSSSKAWHIFVGRFGKDTAEEDVKEHLEENDVKVFTVSKVKPTKEWMEKSSAFRVSVDLKCKDMIMNSEIWPDNVEVIDWLFKAKN